MMTKRAELTRQFCNRWLEKAARYDTAQLQDAFDKFFTLFVAFNRLYIHAAQVAGQAEARDRVMATRLFPTVVGHQRIFEAITSDGKKDLQVMRQLIGPEGSFFLFSGADLDAPDERRDADLYLRLGNDSPRAVVEALLDYLYKVRCNMFHGSKGFEERQLHLLQPCLRSLERVIRAGFEMLDADDGA